MTTPQEKLSICCNAPVTTNGIGDFRDGDRAVTTYYVCTKCGEACDIIQLNRMNDIEKRIEEVARLFHDTYERLAPKYGYFTRIETREWNPESNNGRLMLAVVGELYPQLLKEELAKRDGQWAHELGKVGFDKSKFDSILATLNKEKD